MKIKEMIILELTTNPDQTYTVESMAKAIKKSKNRVYEAMTSLFKEGQLTREPDPLFRKRWIFGLKKARMNELQVEIISCLFNDDSGWTLDDLSHALKTPAKETHHLVMELVEKQIVVEKPEKDHYPWPKVYWRLLGIAEKRLSDRDQYLLADMRDFDKDNAWGLEWWFYNDIWPTLQTDSPPDQNIPILKEYMSAALKYYRDEILTKPDAPFQEPPPWRKPKLTI